MLASDISREQSEREFRKSQNKFYETASGRYYYEGDDNNFYYYEGSNASDYGPPDDGASMRSSQKASSNGGTSVFDSIVNSEDDASDMTPEFGGPKSSGSGSINSDTSSRYGGPKSSKSGTSTRSARNRQRKEAIQSMQPPGQVRGNRVPVG